MWDFFHQVVKHPAFGIVSGLIGFLIGNRFAIDRDKRKEFNNLIEPLRRELIGVRNNPESSIKDRFPLGRKKYFPKKNNPGSSSVVTFTLIHEKIPFWKRKDFNRAVGNYINSKSEENITRYENAVPGFKDRARVIDAANELLKYLRNK